MSDPQDIVINHWRLDTWFPDLGPELLKNFRVYYDELIKFNKNLNLVSPKTIPMADVIHFADGIITSRVIAKSPIKFTEIYDVGSGSGFPGIIFGMMNPAIKVFLVEPDQKKCEFLKHIINSVHAKNIEILNVKIETIKDGSITYALVRGFASISKTIMLMRKVMPKGGAIFHIKGEEWGMEVSEIPIQLCSMWAPGLVGEYRLPIGEVRFAVIKTDKIA